MKRSALVTFLILAAILAFPRRSTRAQIPTTTYFSGNYWSAGQPVEYGMVAQLWNPSSVPIYLDEVSVGTTPYPGYPMTGAEFGLAFQSIENSTCTPADIENRDFSGIASGARFSALPCSMPTGGSYSGALERWTSQPGSTYEAHFDHPQIIPPGTGIALWQASYSPNGAYLNWNGTLTVTFKWHQ